MNLIHIKRIFDEILSLDKIQAVLQNIARSVENCFTTANQGRNTWIFYAYQNLTAFLSVAFLMGWKVWKYPIPHAVVVAVFELPAHPIFGVFSKTSKGNYNMNQSILSHSLTVLTDEYHRYNELHAQEPFNGYCERANAIYNAIHALKSLDNAPCATYAPPKPKSALKRILNAIKGGAK
ncbi:hypothetical protein LU293_07350 [Moraxella nasovis]|uniref:hypothetical protein n=1 Tax=Moraxella nasovis TaxID=2904121 RepID=UPI001F61DDB2|nr:hypothetical protein [Moraxella nasovis]UNU72903.1 hypothetical protein LU293_07350 [Moraxella nasovis]